MTGIINGKVKGGFTVDVSDIRAFLPGSLVDIRPLRETAHLEGKPLEFKVIKLDQKRNNVVVSRRAVLEEENSVEREALLASAAGRPDREGHRQEPHGLRCLRGSGRCRRPAAHHRHGLAPHSPPVRDGHGRRRGGRQDPQVRPGEEPRQPRHEAAGRRSVGRHHAAATRKARGCGYRHQPHRLRLLRRDRGRASKAWCTSPRWTGPTRTSTRRRSCT